ncbi:MAG: CpaF family protein [Chloroflexota bacterium]|nr:MAG: CpaF family protein [Chloroflexota bacterium]
MIGLRNGDYAALVPALQEYLLTRGIPIPRWRQEELDGPERQAFAAQVLKGMVDLKVPVGPEDLPEVSAEVARRILGLGVLEPYLRDETVSEVIVRGRHVKVERAGRLEEIGDLGSAEYFLEVARRVAELQGRQLGVAKPFVLVDLPDGSRLTAMIPPLSVAGVAINIRRFAVRRLNLEELVERSALDRETASLLERVAGRVNLLVSGAPGAGKTTLLNALSAHFPQGSEVAIVESFRELQVQHPHPAWAVVQEEGEEGRISMGEVVNVIYTRMRPDIVAVGEVVRGDQAAEYVHAINLGVVGLTTIHGSSCLGALHRLETMVLETKPTLNWLATRERIAEGTDIVIQLRRLADGRRRLQEMVALEGLDERGHFITTVLKRWDPDKGSFSPLKCSHRLEERLA